MMKLAYCACGCGKLKRAPLPPKAAALRNRRLIAEKRAQLRAQWDAQAKAFQQHVLGTTHVGGMQ